jgi:hypothetical protein
VTTIRVFTALLMCASAVAFLIAVLRIASGASPLLYVAIAVVLYGMARVASLI